ncbi:MAG TPA: CDP-archaeol synthase [Bradyrhizobium sp.]|uniref:CDP-archaeol synthase n=1 Tax=Bradyrhizobium sp. TaxID=376 RepID=UPI002C14FAC8|nr:CDP-archaeol synthase [Bradyrhizobium sp.]HLZ01144.1 CDP-archaeol synthase [Bradyrhizobium sp.]
MQALFLLTLANGTPVIVKRIFGSRMAFPLDAGVQFLDGQPLFGSSKTVRGVVSSIAVTAGLAPLLGVSVVAGSLAAALAMVGDLFSSFVKRRFRLRPSTQAIGLDQIPESLLPLLACQTMLSLTFTDIPVCVGIFVAGELIISRLLYRLHVRDQPF